MNSLKAEIGIWLLAVFTTVGVLAGAISFVTARHEAWRFFDQQLRIIAQNVDVAQSVPPAEAQSQSHDPEDDFAIQVWADNGQLIREWPATMDLPRSPTSGFSDHVTHEGSWRSYTIITPAHSIQVSQRFEVRDELAREAVYRSVAPIVAIIPLAWLVLGLVITRILRRLERLAQSLTKRSSNVEASNQRLNVPSEVRPFIDSVDAALSGMHVALDAQRRFVADAAHALRTPLAVLQTQVDNLRFETTIEDRRLRIADLERGLRRASLLVQQLLRLARSQSPGAARPPTHVDLLAIVKAEIGDLLPLADQRHQDIGLLHADPAWIFADRDDVRTLVSNLVDNAIRYTHDGGAIDVSIVCDSGTVTLEIRDTGPGLRADQIERVVEPFYRAPDASGEGSGLGLAIVASIATRCGGVVTIANRSDRSGLAVLVTFPNAGNPPAPKTPPFV